jgi:small subunit ribosomal protein S17
MAKATTANSKSPAKPAPAGTDLATATKKIATRTGIVQSDKRDRTRRVAVENLSTHPKYGKILRSRTVLQVHDENNEAKLGDLVEITACRPVSKTKRWKLSKVIQREVGLEFKGVETPDTKTA